MRNTHISGKTVHAAPAGLPIATLPDFTASMISSSLVSRVPPWNTTLRAPPERLVSSSAIHLNAVPLDSGGGVTWGKSSFFTAGLAWPAAGLRPPDSATTTTRSPTTAIAPMSRPRMRPPSLVWVAP